MHKGGDIHFESLSISRYLFRVFFTAVFAWSLRTVIKVSERGARERQPIIPPRIRRYCVFTVEPALEAENEHLAAEVCDVTVSMSSFGCYLQEFRTCLFENEQTAAEGRRVTVSISSFLRIFVAFACHPQPSSHPQPDSHPQLAIYPQPASCPQPASQPASQPPAASWPPTASQRFGASWLPAAGQPRVATHPPAARSEQQQSPASHPS